MSEKTLATLKRAVWKQRLSSVGICLGVLLFFGFILYFTIILPPDEEPVSYVCADPPMEELEYTCHLPGNGIAAPPGTARGEVTAVNGSVVVDPNDPNGEMVFDDSVLSIDLCDLGEGIGCGDAFLLPEDGLSRGLEGVFYDLTRTAEGEPAACEAGDVVERFIASGFQETELAGLYRSPEPHYAGCWYMPSADSAYVVKAYGLGEAPRCWLCVYRGSVRAPKSGVFRFVGTGDDFIAVRFNGELVLQAGYRYPAGGRGADCERIANTPGIPRRDCELGGLLAGRCFEVKEGEFYPIEIAVGDSGGKMGYVLLIQELSPGAVEDTALPDLFRTHICTPTAEELREAHGAYMDGDTPQAPPYNPFSLIWTVRREQPAPSPSAM